MRTETPVWKTWTPPAESDDLWSWQDGRCAMCGWDRDRMARDHCHMTGLIRGLLCSGCNTSEGTSYSDAWDGWRSGDNPANAIGHYEIYRNHMGATSISPQSALRYYSYPEQLAWFEVVVQKLKAGEWTWPEDAVWIESALARKAEAERSLREAMKGWFKDILPSRPELDFSAESLSVGESEQAS